MFMSSNKFILNVMVLHDREIMDPPLPVFTIYSRLFNSCRIDSISTERWNTLYQEIFHFECLNFRANLVTNKWGVAHMVNIPTYNLKVVDLSHQICIKIIIIVRSLKFLNGRNSLDTFWKYFFPIEVIKNSGKWR